MWLLTVVLVPLAVLQPGYVLSESELAFADLPKTALLRTLVGLVAILWLLEWSLQTQFHIRSLAEGSRLRPLTWLRSLKGWLFGEPTRWLTLAVVLYLGFTLLSTALSVSFSVSMWGLIPGQDTYPAYTIIAYIVLFGIIATHLKTRIQLWRLMLAIVTMGVLVGGYSVSQHYGLDLFGLMGEPGFAVSISTMGNPILAGAVLLLTIPICLVAATINQRGPIQSGGFWGRSVLWALLLAVQLLGIIFTSSRGPWVGTIASLVVLIGLVALFVDWRTWGRVALVLGLAAALTTVIILVTPGPTRSDAASTAVQPDAAIDFLEAKPVDIPNRFTSIGREVGGGGLSSRIEIWKVSKRLMFRRPWYEFDNLSLSFARPLIGYGPDMFKYTYLLERRPFGEDRIQLISNRFAHNFFLHKGVELGILGLLASLGVFVALFVVGGYQLFREWRGYSDLHRLLVVGILATLAGRLLEQMVGVAAVSDLTVSWVLLGLFVALPTIMRPSQATLNPEQVAGSARRRRRGARRTIWWPHDQQRFWILLVAAFLIAGIGMLTWTKSINYPWAGVKARDGLEHIRHGNFQIALSSLDRAIDLAPDVPGYHNLRAAIYSIYLQNDQLPREQECGQEGETTAYKICLARKAYISNQEGTKQRPLDLLSRFALARSARTLASLEQNAELADEATRLHRELAEMDPKAWWLWERLAGDYIQFGQPEDALLAVEKALDILKGTKRSANSRLLQGMAHQELGQLDSALRAFDEAIRLDDRPTVTANAYNGRGATRNDLGQYQRAIQDLDEAISLNENLAMAYNNRGNAYGNLDQLERAVEDYDEAIRLNPRFGIAYYNRALAYTYLGQDSEARRNVEKVTELGLEAAPLLEKIEEVKKGR